MTVVRATHSDRQDWLRMRRAFWPDDDDDSHAREIEGLFAGRLPMPIDNLASAAAQRAMGFTETVQIRCFRKELQPERAFK